jgi:GTP-binding protein
MNKLDLPDGIAWEPILKEEVEKEGFEFRAISAVTGQGVREMLYRVKQMLDEAPELEPLAAEIVITAEEDENAFWIEPVDGGWRVHGKRIERVAAMTYFEFMATALRFQRILESMGITAALEKAGIEVGDTVYIGDESLEWLDQ